MKAIQHVDRDERQKQLLEDAAALLTDVSETSPMIGYVVLAFYGDGATRTAGWTQNCADHRIGTTMFQAWSEQTLRNHFVFGEGVRAAQQVLEGE